MADSVTVEMTRRERMHLWSALDRVLSNQPVLDDERPSLQWIRDRIARQCYAEVGDVDLGGDRAEALMAMTGQR